jgi:hypothetical protein
VAPLHEASLDVIGHLLAIGDVPDEDLVEQIWPGHAAAGDAGRGVRRDPRQRRGAAAIRERVRPLLRPAGSTRAEARRAHRADERHHGASGNLVCQLIARSLLAQFAPRMAPLEGHVEVDYQAHRRSRRTWTRAGGRDLDAVRATFETLADSIATPRAGLRRHLETPAPPRRTESRVMMRKLVVPV